LGVGIERRQWAGHARPEDAQGRVGADQGRSIGLVGLLVGLLSPLYITLGDEYCHHYY
jgi:hypothetical protein